MHVQTVSLILPAVFGFLIDFAMSQQRPNEIENEVNIQGITFVEHKNCFSRTFENWVGYTTFTVLCKLENIHSFSVTT